MLGVAYAQAPTFRSTTNLVVVNVSVRDKSGKLVEGLTKNDFQLTENGKPQSISVFEVQHLNSEKLPPLPAEQRLQVRLPERAPAPQPESTGAARFRDRRLIALFFDLSSMQPADQIRAQQAAEKFIAEQMTRSDLVAVMTYSTQLNVVEDFTDDRDRLYATIRRLRIGEGSELALDGTTGPDADDESGAFTADETEFNIFNTDRKLAALEAASRKLSVYPEKKALVYFSGGISKTGVENLSQLRATVNAAVRANVAFYPIDSRGLVASAPAGDASTASPTGTGVFKQTAQQNQRDSFQDQQETLDTLAGDTGGKALLSSNDLTLGIANAQNDINTYYILGYYSTDAALDGKYRRIKVEVPRLAAKLDYRNGYYAAKDWTKFNSGDKERQLQEALALGDPQTDLPLAVEVDHFRIAKDRYFVPVSVKIPGSAIGLKQKGGTGETELDFIGQIYDNRGKMVSGVRDGIKIKVAAEQAQRVPQRQIQYDTGLTLAPGSYRIKILARDDSSGKMGTFETPFVVPDLDKKTGVRMSSVVWSNQREKLASSIGTAGTSKKLEEAHPLVHGDEKLVPNVTRVFRQGQNLIVHFEVYNADAPHGITADVQFMKGQKNVFESTAAQAQPVEGKRAGTSVLELRVPLAKVPPGEYLAQVNVIDRGERSFAFARAPVVVLP